VVVSKDNDFQQMSFVFGAPPKVIWIRRGNCSVEETERILRSNSTRIHEFEEDQVAAYLILS
jgi:predicted nuclease of predicted toxin-antitoxin system